MTSKGIKKEKNGTNKEKKVIKEKKEQNNGKKEERYEIQELEDVLDVDYFEKTPLDRNKVHENQRKCAADIYIHFSNGENYVTLMAEPQVGKTGVLTQCGKHLLNVEVAQKLGMDGYKLIVLSGMSDVDLKKQTKDRIGSDVCVYFNPDLQKLLNNETHDDGTHIDNLLNEKIIFAIDESHFGQDQLSSIHKFLKKVTGYEGELMDYTKWTNKHVKIVTISATSFSECVNKGKKDEEFKLQTVILQPGEKYHGIKDFYENNKIKKSFDLTKYQEAVNFVKENKDVINQKKYMIIRLPNKIVPTEKKEKRKQKGKKQIKEEIDESNNKNNGEDNDLRITVKNNIVNAIKKNIDENISPNISYYLGAEKKRKNEEDVERIDNEENEYIKSGKQLNKKIDTVPTTISIIFVINKLRAGVSLDNTSNISLIHDNPGKTDVAAQSLCGRCCGNNKNTDILIFTNLKFIRQYVNWIKNRFNYETIPTSGKNIKSKNVSTGKEIYSIEKDNEKLKELREEEMKVLNIIMKTTNCETMEMVEQRNRTMQAEFRKGLMTRYKKCIITNNTLSEILQACHILPHSFCQDNCKDKEFDINNGIILESSMHILFDNYYFSINPETRCIELGNKIKNQYSQYDGMEINSLNEETLQNMKHHYYAFKKYEKNKELNKTEEFLLESLNNEKILNEKEKKRSKKD